MSRFHAPEGSVTETAVRQAFAQEHMVPIETAWALEQALNEAREALAQARADSDEWQNAHAAVFTELETVKTEAP